MLSSVLKWITPLLALSALTACGDHDINPGPTLSETREVGNFGAISVRGSARLVVRVGAAPSLSVEGPERAVQQLTTEVDGDTLYIRSKQKEWNFGRGESRLTVHISVPKLEDLKLEGSNDVQLDGFNGGASRIDVEGAANLEASGRLDQLNVHMAGAGRADLSELVAGNATVTVDGVGSVQVHATETLDATMNGVGAILYSGTPREVNTSMNGVGTISRDSERNKEKRDHKDGESAPDPDTLQPEYDEKEVEKQPTSGVV